jgi:hypothetical protein
MIKVLAGNGWLIDQFLHDNINKRTDEYGAVSSMGGLGGFKGLTIPGVTASVTCLVSLCRIDVSWGLVVSAVPYMYPLDRRSLLLSLALDSNIHLEH